MIASDLEPWSKQLTSYMRQQSQQNIIESRGFLDVRWQNTQPQSGTPSIESKDIVLLEHKEELPVLPLVSSGVRWHTKSAWGGWTGISQTILLYSATRVVFGLNSLEWLFWTKYKYQPQSKPSSLMKLSFMLAMSVTLSNIISPSVRCKNGRELWSKLVV